MPLTKRGGSTVDEVSRRFHTTDAAAAVPALSEMNTRPGLVAAQTVSVLLGAREIAILELTGEGVEAHGGVSHATTGLTAIAIHVLWPINVRAIGLECSVVLSASLSVYSVVGSDRHALEL